jgi:hypothetical protein
MQLTTKQKALTPAMWQVLRYTAAHGCAAKIGGPWLEGRACSTVKASSSCGIASAATVPRD